MKLFDKRNIVLIMSIFLLLLMVSSVSAADVSEDAVVGNDAAIDTITSTDTSGSIDDVISAEVSDNPKADPSDSNESLSGDIVADASSNNDNSNQNTVDDSSQDVLKASSDNEVLRATVVYVGGPNGYDNLQAAIRNCTNAYKDYEIVIRAGVYTGTGNIGVDVSRFSIWLVNYGYGHDFHSLVIRADEDATVIFDAQGSQHIFHINSPNVKIKGITFKNAHSNVVSTGFNSEDAGLCLDINDNHVAVEDCIFLNNTAPRLWVVQYM